MLKLKTTKQMVNKYIHFITKGVSSRRSFAPDSVWGGIETATIRKTHPTLGHLILKKYLEQYVLVPTPEAMAFNLHHFKSLVDNPKFSTIVTNITVDGLDEMKKTSKEARDTTR